MTRQLPYIHRIRPLSTIIQRSGFVILLVVMACVVWPLWLLSGAFGLATLAVLVWIGLAPTISLAADDDGLTVTRQPLLRIGGTSDFYSPRDIRRVRYRLEITRDDDDDVLRVYILDLVTVNAGIVRLLTEETVSFDPALGKKLAAALGVAYEEYLDEPPTLTF